MAEAVLFVELVPTTSGVKRGIEKDLNGTFDQADKKGTAVFSKIGGLAKGAAIAAGAAALTLTGIAVKGGFSRMLKIEDAQAKLSGLGNSAEDVEKIMSSALGAVKGTAFGLDTAATVAASAVAAGIKPGQELENYLRLTADAATIAGISMDEMGSIMNKVNANGKAMTDNLNQLSDRGIPILQWLAEEYGVTTEAMSKMVSEGKVDAATFNKVLQDNIGGAALKSGETTRGAFANMLAALSRVGVALIENVFPYFKDTFNGITKLLDATTDRIKPFSAAFGAVIDLLRTGDFTTEFRELTGLEEDAPIVGLLMTLRDMGTEVKGAFGAMFEAFKAGNGDVTSSGLAGFMEQMGNAARTLWDAIGPLVPQLLELWTTSMPLMILLQALGPVIGELAAAFAGLVADALPALLPIIMELAKFIGDVATAIVPLVGVLLSGLMPVFAALVPVVMSIIGALLPIVQGIFPLLMTLVTALTPLFIQLTAALLPVLSPILSLISPLLELVGVIIPPLIELIGFLVTVIGVGLQLALAYLIPAITGVVDAISSFLLPILDYLIAALGGVITFLTGVFTGDWGMAWQGVQDIFSAMWQGIQDIGKGAINFIIDLINTAIGSLNGLAGGISDLTGGAINFTIPTIPRLAAGGVIEATPGGGLFNIGEGRYDEMVVPLSPENMAFMQGGSGGSITQINHIAHMPPEEAVEMAGQRLTSAARRARV